MFPRVSADSPAGVAPTAKPAGGTLPGAGQFCVGGGDKATIMATISYRVAKSGERWTLTRDGKPAEMTYLTQEAAFEVAVGEAGGDLRSGHDVGILVEAATRRAGAHDRGGAPTPGDGFS